MYLGIDPGKQGGMVWLDNEGTVIHHCQMPPTLSLLSETLQEFEYTTCCLEKVQSMPGEGHKGAFTFGFGYGTLQMGLVCLSIPFELVQPKAWQAEFSIPGRKRGEPKDKLKERCHERAKNLFPLFPLWGQPRTKGNQRAICDALLIAEYCRRANLGMLRKS